MESNRFMLGCTSTCPETTWQKLESQRVYLSVKTMKIDIDVASLNYNFL